MVELGEKLLIEDLLPFFVFHGIKLNIGVFCIVGLTKKEI